MKINQLKSHLNTENARPPHRRNSLKFNRDSTQKFRWDSTQVWISIKPVRIDTKVVGMCIKAPPWSSVLVGKTTCAKSVRISTRFVGMCTTSPPWKSILVGISTKWHDRNIINPEFQYLFGELHEKVHSSQTGETPVAYKKSLDLNSQVHFSNYVRWFQSLF